MRISLDGGQTLERAEKLLAGIPGGAEKAVRNAMRRAVSSLRSKSSKAVQERYDISASNLRLNDNVKARYSYQNGIMATVVFAGRKIPLYRYGGAGPRGDLRDASRYVRAIINGQWRTVHPGVPARGHIFKATSPYTFRNAFAAGMKSGHLGIFERTGGATGSDSDEIKELMGLSVPQMIGNEQVSERLAEEVRQKFEERLDHEIERVLFGG